MGPGTGRLEEVALQKEGVLVLQNTGKPLISSSLLLPLFPLLRRHFVWTL